MSELTDNGKIHYVSEGCTITKLNTRTPAAS